MNGAGHTRSRTSILLSLVASTSGRLAPDWQLGRRQLRSELYWKIVATLVATTFMIRAWVGGRTSFAFDDFRLRETTSGTLDPHMLFTSHNGHVNPIGLLLQWVIHHAFPGRYVPLMLLSAALVAVAQFLVTRWCVVVFGHSTIGIAGCLIVGLSPLTLELATWWSVAVYAGPMLAAATWLLWESTGSLLGQRPRWRTWLALGVCLLTATKAVLLPLVVLGLAASYPLGAATPLGYRRALLAHRGLWLGMAALVGAWAALFVALGGGAGLAGTSVTTLLGFVNELFSQATLPALLGGPWKWAGSYGTQPLPALVQWACLVAVLLACSLAALRRPLVWRMLICSLVYSVASALMVGLGRAGLPLTGSALRYTFDLVLPVALTACLALARTRWEPGFPGTTADDEHNGHTHTARMTATAVLMVMGTLGLSTGLTWLTAWGFPELPVTQWSRTARSYYPYLNQGLLEQPAPSELVLLPDRLGVFLSGDPGAPREVPVVLDQLLGFDGQGHLIESEVVGSNSPPATTSCPYAATSTTPVAVPIQPALAVGRHTVRVEYTLTAESAVALALGDDPTRAELPAGRHEAYAVVVGQGDNVRITVANPISRLCVISATAGFPVPLARVDPDSTM